MVDTRAQYSDLNWKDGPMSKKTSWVQGATGTKRYGWTTKRQVNLGAQQVTQSFLVIPECPAPLLGRRLLFKVNAQIHFDHGEISVLDGTGHPIQVLSLALRDEYRLYQPKPLMAIDPNAQPGPKIPSSLGKNCWGKTSQAEAYRQSVYIRHRTHPGPNI